MHRLIRIFALLSAPVVIATAAQAAVPNQLAVAGAIVAAGGGSAVDGDYALTFALYGQAQGGASAWKEGPIVVTVKGGQFAAALGAVNPIPQSALAALSEAWLGVAVGNDPELPRKTLGAVAYALRAAKAEAVDCTGCIGAAHIDAKLLAEFAKSTDLANFVQASALAKVAASGNYKDLANLPQLADVAATGQYKDLLGLPVLPKVGAACGTGLLVKGFKADGSLECADGGVSVANLPKDGLDEISNGLLTNQFKEVAASPKAPIDIADAFPAGVTDAIDVPDFGLAESLAVTIDIVNSDISKLRVTLFDPTGASYKLHDQGGSGTAIKATFKAGDKLVAGDLAPWIGKNAKGIWSLQVADLAGTFGGKDGKLNAWSIEVGTLSTKKVAATGVLQAQGGFQYPVAASHPFGCSAANFGYTYANSKDKALYICNGKGWFALAIQGVGTADNPGTSCKDILDKVPGSKDAIYWVAPPGQPAVQTYCDMTNNGSGWTLAARMVGGSWCHIDANAVGGLTSPGQSGCAKLSDAAIKALYTDQFWLSCGNTSPHRFGKIDNIANFDTTAKVGNKKMTWSMTYGGPTYSGTDEGCCNLGDHNYHSPHIIYSIATGYNNGNYKADWSGCYNSPEGWHRSGYLYVR
ncbi:MAG: proprotein convertase P-domain-containing protein [Deltaproteobacteria bacterium]|nr:proprotein convertase P-domain-containing protein [Deltaproteobacteria bacterium]